jgi:CRISPR-associated protein Csb2
MITLRIEFIAGQLHAPPWTDGTNFEIEWPPAPWRLLQALANGWYRTGSPERDIFLKLLDRLITPPVYYLPRATTGNTCHRRMGVRPTEAVGPPEPLDSFIALDRDIETLTRAYAVWTTCDLVGKESELLSRSCDAITDLGSARSSCSVHVSELGIPNKDLVLIDLESRTTSTGPTVSRLAPDKSARGEQLLSALLAPNRKLTRTTTRPQNVEHAGPSIHAPVIKIRYRIPPDFLMVREQYQRKERMHDVFGPTLLRFTLGSGRRTGKNPPLTDTIIIAECLRAAAIERLSRREGEPATLRLAGKDLDGAPARGHGHPYFLPISRHASGQIDGIDVWFPSGCTFPEYKAVTSLTTLYVRRAYSEDFPLAFLGTIDRERASTWRTATPVVLDRFPKYRDGRLVDSPVEQVARMVNRTIGEYARVEVSDAAPTYRKRRWRKRLPPLPVVTASLHFERPIEGPIALGRLAHFGLGRFEPGKTESSPVLPTTGSL